MAKKLRFLCLFFFSSVFSLLDAFLQVVDVNRINFMINSVARAMKC